MTLGKGKVVPVECLGLVRGTAGVALVTVLLVFTILLTLGLGALGLALTHREVSLNEVKNAKAFYAAEAGINVALAELQSNPSLVFNGNGASISPPDIARELEGAQIEEIAVNDRGDLVEVQARGKAGGLTRQVAAYLQKPVWAYGLVLGQGNGNDVVIKTNVNLKGTFVFPDDVDIERQVKVDGWVIAGGDIDNDSERIKGGLKAVGAIVTVPIDGQIVRYAPPYLPSFMAPKIADYRGQADEKSYDDLTIGEEELRRFAKSDYLVFIDGDLTIECKDEDNGNGKGRDGDQGGGEGKKVIEYSGRAVLVASGNIEVKTDIVKENEDSALALVAGGNIDIKNHEVHAVLWAGGALETNGHPVIVGAAAAGSLNAKDESGGDGKGKLKFHLTYDTDLVAQLLSGDSPLIRCDTSFKIVRWWAKGS